MRKVLLTTAVSGIFIILTQCSKSNNNNTGGGGSTGTGNTINIYGMTFPPSTKTVAKGSVVKWQKNDGSTHTATSNDGVTFNTGNIGADTNAAYTANTAGSFSYHCTIHGIGMSGTLVVTP